MFAIAVGSCAMIMLFSVFNGFEDLIKDLYKAFYSEIKITAAKGKFFSLDEQEYRKLTSINGITAITSVIEDNVLLNTGEEEYIATLKGIDRNYFAVNNVKPYILEGRDSVAEGALPTAILGLHIANQLGVDVNNVFSRLSVFYPNTESGNFSLNPESAFQSLELKPDGVFRVQDEFDTKYILAPIRHVQELFLQPGKYSSLELSLAPDIDPANIQQQLQSVLGGSYKIATRFEQNKTLYMVMKTEKWAGYAILLLVLLIASFNMIGALTLLVLEKEKDIAILKAMGAPTRTIRSIFISEGILWAFIGGSAGLILGAAICLGQQHFGWIKLEGAFIIDAYPVALQWTDFILTLLTVGVVGLLAAWYPALRATKVQDPSLKAS
jgi:lipoprotein-releasing system permease protein